MQLNYHFEHSPTAQTDTPLVLIHGLFGDKDNLNGIRRLLISDYHILTLDVRNHGHSPWNNEMDYPCMADDVRELLDHHQCSSAFVLGHSMGGKIAMTLALQHPDRVAALMVLDMAPVAYTQPRHTRVFAGLTAVSAHPELVSRQAADRVLADHVTDTGVRQFLLKSFAADRPGHWRFNLQTLAEHYQTLMGWQNQTQTTYSGATLFLRGGMSDYIQDAYFPDMARQFPAAQGKLLPECGHWLHAEKPERVAGLIQRFLHTCRP